MHMLLPLGSPCQGRLALRALGAWYNGPMQMAVVHGRWMHVPWGPGAQEGLHEELLDCGCGRRMILSSPVPTLAVWKYCRWDYAVSGLGVRVRQVGLRSVRGSGLKAVWADLVGKAEPDADALLHGASVHPRIFAHLYLLARKIWTRPTGAHGAVGLNWVLSGLSWCTVHCTMYTIQCTQSTVHYTLHSALYNVHSALCNVHCALYTIHCTVHYTMYTVHCSLHTVHCTLYTAQCTIQCTQCTVHYTPCTVPRLTERLPCLGQLHMSCSPCRRPPTNNSGTSPFWRWPNVRSYI